MHLLFPLKRSNARWFCVKFLQNIYQACRGWTIAIFQHLTANDFIVQLLGDSIYNLGRASSTSTSTSVNGANPSSDKTDDDGKHRRTRGLSLSRSTGDDQLGREGGGAQMATDGAALGAARPQVTPEHAFDDGGVSSMIGPSKVMGAGRKSGPPDVPRRRLQSLSDYDDTVNPAADVFTLTAGAAAFESALSSTVRIVSEGYVSTNEDNVELTVACVDLSGLVERNDVGDILRGAVLSPALAVDTYYSAAMSNLSPLFKLPVDAVQRCREHGLPTYNSAREVSPGTV